jgi:uncharacterized protein YjbI with pentapeptide repeats
MANDAHVKILKEGVSAWNKWREENPVIRPDLKKSKLPGANLFAAKLSYADLSEADLSGADLIGANLHRANLSGAFLSRANLDGADLSGAKLFRAKLSEANLSGANLSGTNLSAAYLSGAFLSMANLDGADLFGANLSEAYLSRARLSEADLSGANLSAANLSRANLSEANLSYANLSDANLSYATLFSIDLSHSQMVSTIFGDVDLSEAKGLETVKHFGPSTIGIDSIFRSKGKIPEIFLRGAGVPEGFITYMKSLVVNTIEYYSCFISYSSKDEEFAKRLHTDLQAKHVRCWFAPEDLKIGERFRPKIDEAIRLHDKLLLVLSKNSLASTWVETEVESAFEREHKEGRTVFFPLRLDNVVLETDEAWAADIRRTRHIGDFSEWKNNDSYQKGFVRLLRDLQAEDKADKKESV